MLQINLIIPFQLAIDKLKDKRIGRQKYLKALSKLKPESNSIIKRWKKLGVEINSANETQGLLEQKNRLCNEKKCLFCGIGKSVLAL